MMTEGIPALAVESVSSIKMLRAMVGIGVFCALVIVLTYEGTFERIESNKAEALQKAIFKVLPGITKKTTFQIDQNLNFAPLETEENQGALVYAGYDQDDKLIGIALEASGMGFADVLRILYGYDPSTQKVIGFYVLESKETPGLGDKIEKDEDFLANFIALDVTLADDERAVQNIITPVKHGTKKQPWEVDGITGATISSRAIGNILGESTAKWIPAIYKNKEMFRNEGMENLED